MVNRKLKANYDTDVAGFENGRYNQIIRVPKDTVLTIVRESQSPLAGRIYICEMNLNNGKEYTNMNVFEASVGPGKSFTLMPLVQGGGKRKSRRRRSSRITRRRPT